MQIAGSGYARTGCAVHIGICSTMMMHRSPADHPMRFVFGCAGSCARSS